MKGYLFFRNRILTLVLFCFASLLFVPCSGKQLFASTDDQCSGEERASVVVTAVHKRRDGTTRPIGPGVHIRINGKRAALTDENSRAEIIVPATTFEIAAIIPSRAYGADTLTLKPDEQHIMSLLLHYSDQVTEKSDLKLYQLEGNFLPSGFDNFVLAFIRDGTPHPLRQIDDIRIVHPKGGDDTRIEHLFRLRASGEMFAFDLKTLRGLFRQRQRGGWTVRVRAVDKEGFTHLNEIKFKIR